MTKSIPSLKSEISDCNNLPIPP